MSENNVVKLPLPDSDEIDFGSYSPVASTPNRAEPLRTAPPAMAGLLSAIARLEEVIDQETEALESRRPVDLQDFNHRKSRSLLELTRMVRAVPARTSEETLRPRLVQLRAKLARNQSLLGMHLAAAQEIASILTAAIGAADSDGTYGRVVGPASSAK